MITAAYSPEGAAWVDAQIAHLQTNREIFDAGIQSAEEVCTAEYADACAELGIE